MIPNPILSPKTCFVAAGLWLAGIFAAQSSESTSEYDMPLNCGLAIYHAFKKGDENLAAKNSTITEHAPIYGDRVTCKINSKHFIVRIWNDTPGMLGGAVTYKLDDDDYSIIEVVPER